MATLLPAYRVVLSRLGHPSAIRTLAASASTVLPQAGHEQLQRRQNASAGMFPETRALIPSLIPQNGVGGLSIARRGFHASAVRRRDHHFDTLKFVQRLQSEGFTEDQSVAMM